MQHTKLFQERFAILIILYLNLWKKSVKISLMMKLSPKAMTSPRKVLKMLYRKKCRCKKTFVVGFHSSKQTIFVKTVKKFIISYDSTICGLITQSPQIQLQKLLSEALSACENKFSILPKFISVTNLQGESKS